VAELYNGTAPQGVIGVLGVSITTKPGPR